MKPAAISSLLLILLILAGCGQKGPLRRPEQVMQAPAENVQMAPQLLS